MLYTFKGLISSADGGFTKAFPIAIGLACKFNVEQGDGFIDFIYTTTNDEVGNKRIWTPSMDKLYPKDGEGPMEAYARTIEEYLAFIVSHMKVFVPKELLEDFGAESYQEFAAKGVEFLTKYKDTALLNVKSIPDANLLYSSFGRYPNYFEKHEDGTPTKLKYSNWELSQRIEPWKQKLALQSKDAKDTASDLV